MRYQMVDSELTCAWRHRFRSDATVERCACEPSYRGVLGRLDIA
jgi:hypothetical protein